MNELNKQIDESKQEKISIQVEMRRIEQMSNKMSTPRNINGEEEDDEDDEN